MPVGGKRLRCDSSIRVESSPGTLAVLGPLLRDRNELPSSATASPVGTQSSCASTSGIRHVRGSTRGIALLKARTGGKLTVHIPDGYYDQAEDRIIVTSTIDTAYRMHKNKMFQHYSVFNSKEEVLEHSYPEMNKEEWTRRRSAINKENRAKLKIVHTSGARSFQCTREKMEALQLQHESEGKSYTEVEIFAEVLGTKASYVRGLGRSVRYGVDDARASADDGGATTEERRRADADDGGAATEKRRRASEDDVGAIKKPSVTTRTADATNDGADA
ncbi:hypothetical protein CJ030_MR7G016935 [Morella rubra]|uniref:Uncharacterized protein n=1 Tax=Morella rubra TaxID=262757 RepID=A0A6A1UZY2_9ROSI|nr:hypothetical protein CJ030_MR7G016935 [Morella rubra]